MLFLLSACAPTPPAVPEPAQEQAVVEVGPKRRTYTGILETTGWIAPPGYGEFSSDETEPSVVLLLDTPMMVSLEPARASWVANDTSGLQFPDGPVLVDRMVVVPGMGPLRPDSAIAACIGRHATVTAALLPAYTWTAGTWTILVEAKVTDCADVPLPDGEAVAALPFGPTTLTGTLGWRWAFGRPGFGADPSVDKQVEFPTIELAAPVEAGGRRVTWLVAVPDRSLPEEQRRRVLFACQGQQVTVSGRLRPPTDPRAQVPAVLGDVHFDAICTQPTIFRGVDRPPKPMPGWIEAGAAAPPEEPAGAEPAPPAASPSVPAAVPAAPAASP
jgi:hypothetical protein